MVTVLLYQYVLLRGRRTIGARQGCWASPLYETLFGENRVRYPAGSTGMGGHEGTVTTVGRTLVRL